MNKRTGAVAKSHTASISESIPERSCENAVDTYIENEARESYPSIEELFTGYHGNYIPEEFFSAAVGKEQI